jgi:hypothetical protein
MRGFAKIVFVVALMTMAAQFPLGMGALAKDNDHPWGGDRDHHGDRGREVHGAPGPIAGAGLPILAVGYGVYWVVRRYRRKSSTTS